jgi:NAD(P)-dependent dehydrogenase (short-subunit alcohol dehydrogenase family)
MIELTGRVAIVTGASSGLGAVMAAALARQGAKVVLVARRAEQLGAVATTIRDAGGTALDIVGDVTREADVLGIFQATMAEFGRVDILVNNAGIADHTPTDELSLARWHEVIDVNMTAAFLCAREALTIMKRQRRGRIINIGSISCKTPRPDTIAYVASKFALEGMTRSLALDGRDFGVSASILHPGVTATSLVAGMNERPADEVMQAEEVARVLVLMVTLPDEVNMLEGLVLPLRMPFLGRG